MILGRKERPPIDAKNPGNSLGRLDGGVAPQFILVKRPDTKASRIGKGLKGSGVDLALSHDPILGISSNQSSPKIQLQALDAVSNADDMQKTWPQRERFRELVDNLVASGVSKEDQAKGIGIEFSTFVTFYSGKGREPGKKTLRLMSTYYGVQIHELTDDPMAPIPGLDPEVIQSLTPAKRIVMRSVAQKLNAEDVTDETAEIMLKAIASLIDAGKIRPPR